MMRIYPIFLSGLFPIGTWDAMEEKQPKCQLFSRYIKANFGTQSLILARLLVFYKATTLDLNLE
jgi:hypothetical protein